MIFTSAIHEVRYSIYHHNSLFSVTVCTVNYFWGTTHILNKSTMLVLIITVSNDNFRAIIMGKIYPIQSNLSIATTNNTIIMVL